MFEELGPINVPEFARFEDYVGIWFIEPHTFSLLWRQAQRLNIYEHMAKVQEQGIRLASNMEMIERNGKSIARIPVRGLMMKGQSSMGGTSTVQLRRDIRQAANDPNVSGILLDLFSGGGSAIGQADLIADVKAASRRKPIWSQVEDFAASAAYYLAAATDAIYANNNDARVGSIGTIAIVEDDSQAASEAGVKVHVFSTGPLKGAGMSGVAMTDEMAADFQKSVNQIQAGFDATVKNGRSLSAAELAAVRTGGMFFAQEAKQLKLIDGVRSIDSTIAALAAAS